MTTRRGIILGGLAALALGGGAAGIAHRRDRARLDARLAGAGARIVETPFGPLEYAEAGSGPPVLVLHGTGGGFDQGLLMVRPLVARGYRVIAPSRFGYLGSAPAEGRSPEDMADALAALLDVLGLDRVAVAGGSAGAIPAIVFAIRHPGRTAALLPLVPAIYAPGRPPVEPWGPIQTRIAEAVLGSDLLFWAVSGLARDAIVGSLLATDPALVHAAGAAEQARVAEIVGGIRPLDRKMGGLLSDAALTGRPLELDYGAVKAPTLVVSLEDDRFGTAESARHIAARIAGAELAILPSGGHVWVGREDEVFAAVSEFLARAGYTPG